MKFAILVQNLSVGGIQRLVVDEANELARRGHEVSVVTFEPKNAMRAQLRIPDSHVIYIPYARLRNISAFFALVKTVKALKPDVMITHHWFANTAGRAAAAAAAVPVTLSFEHSTYDNRKPAIQFFVDRIVQGLSLYVIAVSEPVRDSLIRNGIDAKRIRVLQNGIDLTKFSKSPKTLRDTCSFLYIGRLIDDKGVSILLNAFAHVPNATLTIVGDGPERARLERQARMLGIHSRTQFLGVCDDISALLKKADALVLPSLREGFGLVAVEALASGVPVIASDLPALAAIVRNDKDGLLVAPNDEKALQKVLSLFAGDVVLRRRLTLEAGNGIDRFSISTHIDGMFALVSV